MTRQWTTFFAAAVLVAVTAVVGTAQQESIEELRARAEVGDALAQYNLGVMSRDGQGVLQDDAEGLITWRSTGPATDEKLAALSQALVSS